MIESADATKPTIDGDTPTIASAGSKPKVGMDEAEKRLSRYAGLDRWVELRQEGREQDKHDEALYGTPRQQAAERRRRDRLGLGIFDGKTPTHWEAYKNRYQFVVIPASILLIGWLVWFLFIATSPQQLTVESHSWQRRIEVIDYQPRADSGWSYPGDAYDISSSMRIHHYDHVFSHYETRTRSYSCGTTQAPRTCTTTDQVAVYKDVPVYRRYYHFTVNRWRHARWLTTGSESYSTPYWHDLSKEHFDSANVIGNEALSGVRSENYKVILVGNGGKGRHYERVIDLDTWNANRDGSVVTAHITRTNIVRSVDWVDPAVPSTTVGS